MTSSSTSKQYPKSAIALHWVMLFLIVSVYAAILLREYFPRGSDIRQAFKTWHFMLGLSVLSLIILRVTLRLTVWKIPSITPQPVAWQKRLGGMVHFGIYALLIAMPIGGWLILSGEGKTIPFWGLSIPPLMPPNKPLAEEIEELHEIGGKIGYALIGLHAVAGLFHHYVLKDNALFRILPLKILGRK
jgi:cytochrome b561